MATRRRRTSNVERGFYDATGFHPLRSSGDYDPDRAGDDYSDVPKRKKKPKTKSRSKRKNPIPTKFTAAKVRRVGNKVQILLPSR